MGNAKEKFVEIESALRRIKFSVNKATGDREHYLSPEDIRTVLRRMPLGLWGKLRAIHFNDQSRGVRTLGYVTRGYREIAICALPPRISLTRFLECGTGSKGSKRLSPKQFGAVRGAQWPRMAVRRFLLYGVFLHELGHLQVVEEDAVDPSRRYAKERKAQEFADYWRRELWTKPFENPAPEHNPPSAEEMKGLIGNLD
jgi:hypothetical protein